jgi:hypothetical protein
VSFLSYKEPPITFFGSVKDGDMNEGKNHSFKVIIEGTLSLQDPDVSSL